MGDKAKYADGINDPTAMGTTGTMRGNQNVICSENLRFTPGRQVVVHRRKSSFLGRKSSFVKLVVLLVAVPRKRPFWFPHFVLPAVPVPA